SLMLSDASPYKRFEALEHYTTLADTETDVLNLVRVLESDSDPIVRHEAAAQLLRVETSKPLLTANVRHVIRDALIKTIREDGSVIVRHEAMEALAYVGEDDALFVLESLLDDPNMDIKCTAR